MRTKNLNRYFIASFLSVCLFSCEDNDDNETIENDETTEKVESTENVDSVNNDSDLVQFTPDQADWAAFNQKPFVNNVNTSHDPDGIGWIPAKDWENSQWDGTTIYDPTTMTKEEFHKALFPVRGDILRGIREVFYEHQPFADNKNPTKAEVDEWHRIAINHLRALVGYTSADRQVQKDHCMFARALWGQQRNFTTMWDADYPGETGSAYGPCQGGDNAHCGASFVPNETDQIPYLPEGYSPCGTPSGAEGISNAPKSNIPWSIKWSRAISGFIATEGFWGGHVGPFFHREKFGFSFWDFKPDDNNSNAVLRGKWTGALMPSLYENPN